MTLVYLTLSWLSGIVLAKMHGLPWQLLPILGLVGLLTALMLKASGCRVLGVDIDSQKVAWVEENGICSAVPRNAANLIDRILDFSGGYGQRTFHDYARVGNWSNWCNPAI